MRLDKFLSNLNMGSRSQVKELLKKGSITVNGRTAVNPRQQIDERKDSIICCGQQLVYQPFFYYLLNKPAGVVSATEDRSCKTVVEFLPPDKRKDIFPVGRLDKDTEGLLLLTNDGELAHRLLSPKKHVDKVYLVKLEKPLSREQADRLEQGVDIGEKKLTLPAKVNFLSPLEIELTIREGKFHQIKRMMQAVDNRVLYLKRIAFGNLRLYEDLKPGEWRELTAEELGKESREYE